MSLYSAMQMGSSSAKHLSLKLSVHLLLLGKDDLLLCLCGSCSFSEEKVMSWGTPRQSLSNHIQENSGCAINADVVSCVLNLLPQEIRPYVLRERTGKCRLGYCSGVSVRAKI